LANHVRKKYPESRLIIINQSVGPAFVDWMSHLSAIHGRVELWSGTALDDLDDGVSLIRQTTYDNSSKLKRLATWTKFTLESTVRLLCRRDRTPLLIVTNPPFMPVPAWAFRVLQGRHYILLEWDIYPQILRAMGLISRTNLIYRLWRICHAKALRDAELVITISAGLADELRRISGETDLPVSVIPNWVNTAWIKPLDPASNPFVREQKLAGKVVVLYSGNLGSTHAIETILEVARLMVDEPRLLFLIIGEGSKRGIVEAAIKRGITPNLRLLPHQPESLLPFTLSSGHIGIVTLEKGYESLSMPSKTYAMMAAGNAILGISQPPNDLERTIHRFDCGVNFRPDDPVAISVWIQSMLDDGEALSIMQAQSRRAAITEYSAIRCIPLLNEEVSNAIQRMNASKEKISNACYVSL
jgi:glycosyltransferase involved in cell wall biosynthesis